MAGSCNGCGDCCRVVFLSADLPERLAAHPDFLPNGSARDREWMENDLVKISRRTANRRLPSLKGWRGIKDGFYRCRRFDEATNRCLDHGTDRKPLVCTGFPWYGQAPRHSAIDMFLSCGYVEDIPEWPEDVKVWRERNGAAEFNPAAA